MTRRIVILGMLFGTLAPWIGVWAAPPELAPRGDVFAGFAFALAARFELTATDPDPGESVSFELVDPDSGELSPLMAYLTPREPVVGFFAADFFWDVQPTDAGIYPLRAIARDSSGEVAIADFTLRVFAASDDITIPEIIGPAAARINSEDNPEPHGYEIAAESASGQTLSYQLTVTSPSGTRTVLPFQPSPSFMLNFDELGLYTLYSEARSAVSFSWPRNTAAVLVWQPDEVIPPDARATYTVTTPGQIQVRWPSHPANTTITAYRLTLSTVYNAVATPIVHEMAVPEPTAEPATWSFDYDFANDPLFQQLIAGINAIIVDSPTTYPFISVTIEAVTDDPSTAWPYMPYGPFLGLSEVLPHVDGLVARYDADTRTVRVTLGDLVLPSGSGTPVELRYLPQGFGDDPSNVASILNPVSGMTFELLNPADAQPISAGQAPDTVFVALRSDGVSGLLRPYPTTVVVPECWDGIDNDGDGFTDLDGGDPGCVAREDPIEFDVPDELDIGHRALVVYNVNATEAAAIAEYYRQARGLDAASLCPVALPPGHYATADQLLGARRTILETCLCENVLQRFDHECVDVSGEALAADSPVTHLVLIRGIPARLTGTSWSTNWEEPSFDYYLAWSLYHDAAIFAPGEQGAVIHGPYDGTRPDQQDYQPSRGIDARVRALDPEFDQLVAYGRVEAVDAARTLALIDRTLAAEASGLQGNFLEQGNGQFELYRRYTSSLAPVCRSASYIADPDTDWPHLDCRAGTSERGLIPGRPSAGGKLQSIPYPVNAGIYLGNGLPSGGHKAFNGFYNMIRWRRMHPDDEQDPCIPLCADFADPSAVMACREASTDWFREINTECVGVAPGFLGWQFRSWPVQYYGFHPAGWFTDAGGHTEKIPPRRLSAAEWGESFIRFGSDTAALDPVCVSDDAPPVLVPCPERLPLYLGANHVFPEPQAHDSPRPFGLRFRYRRERPSTGRLQGQLEYRREDGTRFFETVLFDMAEERTEWTLAEATFTASVESSPLRHVTLTLKSTFGDNLAGGWLDLDHVELFDAADPLETNLIDPEAAGFEKPQSETHHGDWAANVIDRLGGIAWWGSGSHHQTGGRAFERSYNFAGSFFSGRTLGESLIYLGANARSGTIYGDPLYRPSGAKLWVGDGLAPLNRAGAGYTFHEAQPDSFDPNLAPLRITAFHGSGNRARTRWVVSKCEGADLEVCHREASWVTVETHEDNANDAVYDLSLDTGMMDLIDADRYYEDQQIVLWLRVWNPGEEGDDLSNYGYLRYVAADNHVPVALSPAIVPHDAAPGEALTASWVFEDVDGDAEDVGARTIRWFRNGAHEPSWDDVVTVPGAEVAIGDAWHFELVVSDGELVAPATASEIVTIACRGPVLPVRIVDMEVDPGGDAVLFFSDPNPATRVSGYLIYRGSESSDLSAVDAVEGLQYADSGSATGEIWFYRVNAINSNCSLEGPAN